MKISNEPINKNNAFENHKSYVGQDLDISSNNNASTSSNIRLIQDSSVTNINNKDESLAKPIFLDINQKIKQSNPKNFPLTNTLSTTCTSPKNNYIKNNKKKCKNSLTKLIKNKYFDAFFIALISLYMILILGTIIIDDLACQDSNYKYISNELKYVELIFVLAFIIEITLKIYAFGFWKYYSNKLYIIDTIIILSTFGLVILDVVCTTSIPNLANLRGIFRIFRIFLLISKTNEFSNIARRRATIKGIDVKSPVEKILEMLRNFEREADDENLRNDLKWAIDIISNNKLYEPVLDESLAADKRAEARDWVNSYNINQPVQEENPKNDQSRVNTIVILDTKKERRASLLAISSLLSNGLMEKFENEIDNLEFNIFEIKNLAEGEELSLMLYILFKRNELYDKLGIRISTFLKFAKKIQASYLPNPYHNSTHGTDVLQTLNYFLTTGEFISKAGLNELEIASMFLAAAVHDLQHPGYNNTYLINTKGKFAIRYNDRAVLENHHISATFKILLETEYNIFENFSKENYNKARERMIAMVLATDMAQHFNDIGKFKARLTSDFTLKDKDKHLCMELILHCSDISNPAKPWEIYRKWTDKVLEEFWNQGDKERELGLPISYLCDRYTTNKAKSQISFIDFIVQPTWELMRQALCAVDTSNLELNKLKWKELIEYHEKELAMRNEEFNKKRELLTDHSIDENKEFIKK